MKVVLIFGGTGFLGSALVKYLLSKNLNVIVYKHRSLGCFSNFSHDNLIFIDSFDNTSLLKYKIDVIYHLASKQISGSPTYDDFYYGNVEVTKKIIELSKKLQIQQFLYVSTTTVFSKKNTIFAFDETTSPDPKNFYGLTKYIAEKLIEIEFDKTNIKTCIVRFPSIFGVNSGGGIVETFYKLAKENNPIEVYSNGQRLRNLIYVDSAVEMLYLLYKNKKHLGKNEIFMAGSKDSLKLIEIARLVGYLVKSSSSVIPVEKFPPSDFDVVIDTSKAKRILGFEPLSIEDGLKKYIKEIINENL